MNSNLVTKKNIFLTGGALFLFGIFSIYSLGLQLSAKNYLSKSIDLNLGEIDLQPKRGNFYDTNGIQLTGSQEVYTIKINKVNISSEQIANLAIFIKDNSFDFISNKDVLTQLSDETVNTVSIIDLTGTQAKTFKDAYIDNSFYNVSFITRRYYNYPFEYTHTIGYVGKATAEDLQAGYANNDFVGNYKMEYQYEDMLKGTKGKKYYVGDVEVQENPEPGDDINLTIDNSWQTLLYRLLQKNSDINNAAGGGGVVIDNSNGELIALTSYPGINTNDLLLGLTQDEYNDLLNNRNAPLTDKSIGTADAPGSIFKIISAYSLLENKVVDKDSSFYSSGCMPLGGGYNFCEYGKLVYGQMNIERALYKSSNMFFCNYTLGEYPTDHFENMVKTANIFGLGNLTNIDIVGETKGNMDSPKYRKDSLGLSWFDGDTCNAAIGQGSVLVTPIQMAVIASIIANNGKVYQPHVLKNVQDVYKNVVKQTDPTVVKQIPISDETLRLINSGMSQVANNPEGTVYYFLNGLPGNIRAKTGTAEAYENVNGEQVYRTHGWIVGTFDYNSKSYSYAFHLKFGGGGFLIGNLLKEFVRCVYANNAPGCDS
ncbi:MAG: penicillin-binding transpeptidase domain-containing protein [Candidatus Dojkabacteria bacterium]